MQQTWHNLTSSCIGVTVHVLRLGEGSLGIDLSSISISLASYFIAGK